MNFNFDGVNIALQVDLSQNASLNHQGGIQLMHWCQEQATTYAWIAKAVEDGFLCQRQLCHCLRSKETQVYVPVYLYLKKTVFADLKASSLSFLLENICSSSNASCSQTSICGSKNISDGNLESFNYRTCGNGVDGTEYGTRCSKLHRACLSPVVLL